MNDWQSIAALVVVIATVAVFIGRAVRRAAKKGDACGGGCGCALKPKAPAASPRK